MGGGRRKFKPRGKFVNKDRFIDASKAKESKQEQKERDEKGFIHSN